METMADQQVETLSSFWKLYDEYRSEIFSSLDPKNGQLFGTVSVLREDVAGEVSGRQLERRALEEEHWEPLEEKLRQQGARWPFAGDPVDGWMRGMRVLRSELTAVLGDTVDDPELLGDVLKGAGEFTNRVSTELMRGYVNSKEETIADQQLEIEELSTPVLQIEDRLLVVPLVGMIDTARARKFTEKLLYAIRERRAAVVVVDITGVPVVDTGVANHLVKTVDAAGLMGTKVFITGISPDIAQTLVRLGASLPGVNTLGTLQEGLQEARAVIESEGRR